MNTPVDKITEIKSKFDALSKEELQRTQDALITAAMQSLQAKTPIELPFTIFGEHFVIRQSTVRTAEESQGVLTQLNALTTDQRLQYLQSLVAYHGQLLNYLFTEDKGEMATIWGKAAYQVRDEINSLRQQINPQ